MRDFIDHTAEKRFTEEDMIRSVIIALKNSGESDTDVIFAIEKQFGITEGLARAYYEEEMEASKEHEESVDEAETEGDSDNSEESGEQEDPRLSDYEDLRRVREALEHQAKIYALYMIKNGKSNEEIASILDLPEEEIEELRVEV